MSFAARFRELHHTDEILLMPDAWDVGSAAILCDLGFLALATTSSGAAAARGKLDGTLDRDVVLAHCAELAAAVDVPVSADLENAFADDPAGVAETIRAAARIRLAGASWRTGVAPRSTTWRWRPSGCARLWRVPPGRWSSPREPRTTSAASTI